MSDAREGRSWTFLTNHAHVLLAIARTPDLRLRDIAQLVGITERTAMQIIGDLERDGYIGREREGRRNRYRVDLNHPLRHPLEQHHDIEDLVQAIGHRKPPGTATDEVSIA
jgi:DNA-binding MarR family transcriptional regulator